MFDRLRAVLFNIGETRVTTLSLIIFAMTVVAAVVAGSLARRGIRRFFAKREAEGVSYALERIVQMFAVVIGVFIGLQNIGIDLTALAAFGAVLSVGIGFGLQGATQNFISGLAVLIERPVQKGDFIVIGDTVGRVESIKMRATRILTRDNVAIIVPNSELMTERVTNMSRPGVSYRLRIAVGVAYGSDTERVRDTLLAVAADHPEVLEDPSPVVFFDDFADSALAFTLGVWLTSPEREPFIASDLRFAIDAAFRDNEIQIPFPQRDLHLKSGFLSSGSTQTTHSPA